jgi:regulator of replication initiation timing
MKTTLEEVTVLLREMILETGELKQRVAALEKQLNPPGAEENPGVFSEPEKLAITAESFENLSALYSSGYHVCPMFFGGRHEGECLFCVSFLERER